MLTLLSCILTNTTSPSLGKKKKKRKEESRGWTQLSASTAGEGPCTLRSDLLQEMSHPCGSFSLNTMPGSLARATELTEGFVDEGIAKGHCYMSGRKPLVPTGLRQPSGIQWELASCWAGMVLSGSPAQGLDFGKAKVQSWCLLWERNCMLLT